MYFENVEIFLEYSSEESAQKVAEYLKSFYISCSPEETEEKFIEHLPNLTIMNCVLEAVRRGLL